jgi:RES domain
MTNPLTLRQLSVLADRLRGTHQRSRSNDEVTRLLTGLCDQQQVFGIQPRHKTTNIRVRRLAQDEVFSNVSQAIYPPTAPKFAGRANLPDTRVLYAASNVRVALDEAEASAGERFCVAWLRMRADRSHPAYVIGEIESIFNKGSSSVGSRENEDAFMRLSAADHGDLEKAFFVDALLAHMFRRDSKDYQVTSLVANQSFINGHGLVYPSVRTVGGFNFALLDALFDTHHEIVCVEEIVVEQFLGHSCYTLQKLRRSCKFDPDGRIDWDANFELPYEWRIGSGIVVSPEFCGWRRKP